MDERSCRRHFAERPLLPASVLPTELALPSVLVSPSVPVSPSVLASLSVPVSPLLPEPASLSVRPSASQLNPCPKMFLSLYQMYRNPVLPEWMRHRMRRRTLKLPDQRPHQMQRRTPEMHLMRHRSLHQNLSFPDFLQDLLYRC